MNSTNVLTKIPKACEVFDEHSQIIDFNEKNWNCVTSKAIFACYFEFSKEEEENRDGTIRSKSTDKKEFKCSHEEYQQSAPILMENTWHEQLCKCDVCLQIYHKQNVEFLFFIRNIECLPTEMLLMIFKHLTSSDRRVVSECCKRFLEIWLCDDFADDRHRLVFDKCVLDPEREPLSVFLKSERTYRHLAFGDVIIQVEPVFAEKFRENVTTIELMETLSYDYKIRSLLSTFQNLKIIKVSNIYQFVDILHEPTTIELLVISGLGLYENERLNMLKSYLHRTSDSFRVELNHQILTEDIRYFTESERNKIQKVKLLYEQDDTFQLPHFDNLKYLTLDIDCNCDSGTEDVFDNLEKQCPAIKDLSIDICDRLPHKNWTFLKALEAWNVSQEEMSRINIFENLKEYTLVTEHDCFFVHEAFLNKNLKKLNIRSSSYDPCFTCFQTVTKSFPNLESLTCNFPNTNDHLEVLENNTPKLKYLDLKRFDSLVSFAGLPNLIKLNVDGYVTPHMIETWPLMLQLRKLKFCFSHLNLETVKIFERMTALEDLDIFCDSIDGDQRELIEALTKPLKRLKKNRFYCKEIQPEIYPEIIDAMANNCKYLKQIEIKQGASEEILKQILQKHSSIRCIDGVWLK